MVGDWEQVAAAGTLAAPRALTLSHGGCLGLSASLGAPRDACGSVSSALLRRALRRPPVPDRQQRIIAQSRSSKHLLEVLR